MTELELQTLLYAESARRAYINAIATRTLAESSIYLAEYKLALIEARAK